MSELWLELTSWENLYCAFEKARKGKRQRHEVQLFELDVEYHLFTLRSELCDQTYRPGEFRTFQIYDRKPRHICAAPFRDRVVHHALMNIVEPVLEAILTKHCYACRTGKGVHKAVGHYQRGARRYTYALKLDIASYFASIDHAVLKQQIRQCITDERVCWLFDLIIHNAPEPAYAPLWPGADLVDAMQRKSGLPIGNLTSQHMGNLYLNPIDHWLDSDERVPVWLRYVDDIVLLGNSKAVLWELRDELRDRLAHLRLSIHPKKCQIYRCCDGVEVLGYRVFPEHRRLRRENGYRFRRKLRKLARQYADHQIDLDRTKASVAAWLGHSNHADAYGLQLAILNEVCFSRGDSS